MTHLFALPVAIALAACSLMFDPAGHPGQEQLSVLALATTALVAALVFLPQRNQNKSAWLRIILVDTLLVTTVLIVAIFITMDGVVQFTALLRVATTAFLLIVFGMSILAATPEDSEKARQYLLLIFVALLTTPVWLAPVAETSGNITWLTNTIIAVSPLSAFAVALDIDFLRINWFYEHSVLGSLRYTYLSWSMYVAGLATIAGLTIYSNLLIQKRRDKS